MKHTRTLFCAMILVLAFGLTAVCGEEKTADEWYRMYINETNVERKIEYLTRMLELEPDRAFSYYQRGREYVTLGMYDEALADCTTAIELDPEDCSPLVLRSEIYHLQGDNDRALEDVNRALADEPMAPNSLILRADIYRELRRYEKAQADLETVLKYSPEYASEQWYYTRAMTYRDMGDMENAVVNMKYICESKYWQGHDEACAYLEELCTDGVESACSALENLE